MKKATFLFIFIVIFSCNKSHVVKKPDKLIDQSTMVNIMYDLSLVQAVRSINPNLLEDRNISTTSYVYAKYGIDSLQFVENSRYYAADIEQYEKMYEDIEQRLQENKKLLDSIKEPKKEALLLEPEISDSIKRIK